MLGQLQRRCHCFKHGVSAGLAAWLARLGLGREGEEVGGQVGQVGSPARCWGRQIKSSTS